MKFLNLFVLLLLTLTLSIRAEGQGRGSAAEKGSFATLKQDDGTEFRAFVAGPPDVAAGILIVHDYFGISEATKPSVRHLADLGYR
jgi:hypothetical protein